MRNFIINAVTIAVIGAILFWMLSVLLETPEETCSKRKNIYVPYEECVRSLQNAPR